MLRRDDSAVTLKTKFWRCWRWLRSAKKRARTSNCRRLAIHIASTCGHRLHWDQRWLDGW